MCSLKVYVYKDKWVEIEWNFGTDFGLKKFVTES